MAGAPGAGVSSPAALPVSRLPPLTAAGLPSPRITGTGLPVVPSRACPWAVAGLFLVSGEDAVIPGPRAAWCDPCGDPPLRASGERHGPG